MDFGVALFDDMQIEHEIEQRALQHGARAFEHEKARPREDSPRFHVKDAEALGQFIMRQRREVERPRFAPHAQDLVLRIILACGNAGVRQIGDPG